MAAPTHVLATRTVADTNTDIDRDTDDGALSPGGRSFERADENGTKMKYLTKLTILFIYSKFA